MAEKKFQDISEDDGRTIADMSQVSRGHLFGGMHRAGGGEIQSRPGGVSGAQQSRRDMQGMQAGERPWEDAPFTRKERWMYTLGALKASLLIGLVYLAGLGLLVGLMVFFWR
ncbi:MAG: hypothetical protein Q4C61_04775 [Lachnospiraceae bacterium]|nr:hypothetical protein [Lachnospiraceae bacterium]